MTFLFERSVARSSMKAARDSSITLSALCILGIIAKTAGTAPQSGPKPAATTASPQAQISEPWRMHHVCRDFLIANSLNAADVDGDGLDDYSVIDERRGLLTVLFHPGKRGDVRQKWPRLILGETGNPDYACLGVPMDSRVQGIG